MILERSVVERQLACVEMLPLSFASRTYAFHEVNIIYKDILETLKHYEDRISKLTSLLGERESELEKLRPRRPRFREGQVVLLHTQDNGEPCLMPIPVRITALKK